MDIRPLTFPWVTRSPFLFCVHHLDHYPRGDGKLAPAVSLQGRTPGNDFTVRDGFRMYHGERVPGFPQHPHRGFETVTVVQQGYVDHSDSLGATGRYGPGDTQWMTAGRGIQHAEMFPLLQTDEPNPLELFQIWLNLPRSRKMVAPGYRMLWREETPRLAVSDDSGRVTELILVAGAFTGAIERTVPLSPPPDSYAADPGAEVRIWTITMSPNAEFTIPAASTGVNRTLYFFEGHRLAIDDESIVSGHAVFLCADRQQRLHNGDDSARLLLLEGRPIDEPVVSYGPFVMNTREEIQQAIDDYRETGFGGWPCESVDPVHGSAPARFAVTADGRREDRTP